MPKTFPILIEVEEIALGSVLRKLHDMPGIAKLNLQLDHGGQGAGRRQLDEAAATKRLKNGGSQKAVLDFLTNGPKHIDEISAIVGGKKSRAYGVMNQLRKQGLTVSGGHGMHALSHKLVPALPAPARKKGKRASPGAGNIALRAALGRGPLSPADLKAKLSSNGMSEKSVAGVLHRAREGGLIKRNGNGYELTARGHKIELGAAAHG
jgi:hypothetical protein